MAGHDAIIHDRDAMGEKADLSHEEVVHIAALTAEEKEVEVKLRRKIDSLILPLVITVYLMNYIDRYVGYPAGESHTETDFSQETITLLLSCKVLPMICTLLTPSIKPVYRSCLWRIS
jgi:hypothetical protein